MKICNWEGEMYIVVFDREMRGRKGKSLEFRGTI